MMAPRCATYAVLMCLAGALADPVVTTQGLISRVLGAKYVQAFDLQVIKPDPTTGNNAFELDTGVDGVTVVVRGNNGVALSSGLGFYLKQYANCSFSWGRNGSGNQVSLPGVLPTPTAQRHVSPNQHVYMYNVCTHGYSTPWWNYSMWEAEIDRLALWGVNLPLAFVGQEYVIDKVYRSFANLTDSDLNSFFSGPAFLPWQRMGNLQAWGGPLNPNWLTGQRDLQLQIVAQMRAFGMVPVLAGFSGHVPAAIARVFPNSNYTKSQGWGNFNATYSSVTLLEPTDPLFTTLGAALNKAMLAEYGDPTGVEAPFFNSDTYNEMDPSSSDAEFLKASNAAVYGAMTAAHPNSTYVMQAWLFHSSFWSPATVKPYLSGVPLGRMLILDLNTEADPVWQEFDSFYGHNWIWNALEVYGGRRGLYGSLQTLAVKPYADRNTSKSMVGVGITPEAIDEVPIVFDLALEAAWRTAPVLNVTEWTHAYTVRRYGSVSPTMMAAYDVLLDAAYGNRAIDTSSIEKVPEVFEESEPGNSRHTNATGILQALRLVLASVSAGEVDPSTGPFSYDVTDLTRQVLCNIFADAHELLGKRWTAAQALGRNNTAEVRALSTFLTTLISDLDATSGADRNYLLGTWLEDAKAWGSSPVDVANWEFNARNQITLWGPNGEIIDYAARVGWQGLVSDFYGGRWAIFLAYLGNATATGTPPDWDSYYSDILAFSRAWGLSSNIYPTQPNGRDVAGNAAAMVQKYASSSDNYDSYPGTDAGLAPPAVFSRVGGDNEAAVSPDCPFIAHGPGDSLAVCEAACGTDSACTTINWNAAINDCVFRACADPAHPTLTSTDGYSVFTTVSPKGADMLSAWHTDVGVLSVLCSSDPECAGFNSAGLLKSNVTARVASTNVTLYVKRSPLPQAAGGDGEGAAQRWYPHGGAAARGLPILPARPSAAPRRY